MVLRPFLPVLTFNSKSSFSPFPFGSLCWETLLCSFQMVRHGWILTRGRSYLCLVSSLADPEWAPPPHLFEAAIALVTVQVLNSLFPAESKEMWLKSWSELVRTHHWRKHSCLSLWTGCCQRKKDGTTPIGWWAPAGIAASPFFLAWQVLPNELFCIKYWCVEVKELVVAEPRVFEILSFLHIFEYFGDWLCTNLFSGFLYVVNN